MKTIAILLGVFLFLPQSEPYAYLCHGAASTKYHLKKDCKGLEHCSTQIDSLLVPEAQKLGRTLCGWEK